MSLLILSFTSTDAIPLHVLTDMLLTQPIDKEEGRMPSPAQLKRKFIIKHKKLPEGSEASLFTSRIQEDNGPDIDISNAVKNGILYLEDPIDKVRLIDLI